MDFSRIRRARKAANMTQVELSNAVGLDRATISKYESGVIEPAITKLSVISDAIGLPIEFFLSSQPFTDLELLERKKSYIISSLVRDKLFDLNGKSALDVDTLTYWKLIAENINIIYLPTDNGLFMQYNLEASCKVRNAKENKAQQGDIVASRDKERLDSAVRELSLEGLKKTADYAEDLVKIPEYRRKDAPAPSPEGKATPASEPPTEDA